MENGDQNIQQSRKIIEPEIIDPDNGTQKNFTSNTTYKVNYSGPGYWYYSSTSSGSCLSPFITFCLFIFCMAQYGILAGIGFIFYQIVMAVIGCFRAVKRLSSVNSYNFWGWRCFSWAISLLLVIWQSGGFEK